jgi:hypothetical protein
MRTKEKNREEVNVDMTAMKIMRSRLLPVLALAMVALGVIGTAYATGAAEILAPTSMKTMKMTVHPSTGNPNELIVTIWLDGQVWKKMTLPSGEGEYTIKTENGQVIAKITVKTENGRQVIAMIAGGTVEAPPKEQEEYGVGEYDKAVRIAEADERVQKIINGKDYQFTGILVSHGPEGSIAKLRLVAGDQSYDITINLDNGAVVSVEPASGPSENWG